MSPELIDFWSKKLEALSGGSFKPVIADKSQIFTQYRAQHFFNLAIIHHELEKLGQGIELPNLLQAVKYHSFSAVHAMIKRVPFKNLNEVDGLLLNLVDINKTPAMLMRAQAYFDFASQLINSSGAAGLGRRNQIVQVLDQVYIYLSLAEKAYGDSADAIFNAAYGLGMEKIFPTEFQSFSIAKELVIRHLERCGVVDLTSHVSSLIDIAQKKYKNVKQVASDNDESFSSLSP